MKKKKRSKNYCYDLLTVVGWMREITVRKASNFFQQSDILSTM